MYSVQYINSITRIVSYTAITFQEYWATYGVCNKTKKAGETHNHWDNSLSENIKMFVLVKVLYESDKQFVKMNKMKIKVTLDDTRPAIKNFSVHKSCHLQHFTVFQISWLLNKLLFSYANKFETW